MEGATLVNATKYGKETTRITFKQEKENGGSRSITIILPTKSVAAAVVDFPEEMQAQIKSNKDKLWGSKIVPMAQAEIVAMAPANIPKPSSTEDQNRKPSTKKPLW